VHFQLWLIKRQKVSYSLSFVPANPYTLCRLCSDTEKHLGGFVFSIVAPILDGYYK